jgi:hypothetical protein
MCVRERKEKQKKKEVRIAEKKMDKRKITEEKDL